MGPMGLLGLLGQDSGSKRSYGGCKVTNGINGAIVIHMIANLRKLRTLHFLLFLQRGYLTERREGLNPAYWLLPFSTILLV